MYGVNGSSDSISRDMNSLLYSSTFKHPADGEFAKIKHLISLDPYPDYEQSHGSLLGNRSFFSNLVNENGGNDEDEPSESDAREFLQYPMKQEGKETMDLRNSNLIRQSSTPAGFLSSLTNTENGFAKVKGVRKGGPSSSMNNHINFSLGPSSSSRFLPQIAENENELNDSAFNSLKRNRDGVSKISQNGETGNHTPNLVHHMSLPKTSSEMAAVENFLHFQQESSVPWKTRAKRGFATHPRSIAERVRRTRISERIKRLQELFPDMDKQTNTADMLDMAVEYIKDLQKELQTLNDARVRCTCSGKQLQSGSTM